MKKLGIVIDSFSGITEKEAHDLGFYFLPLQVQIDNQIYQDGVADHIEILEKLSKSNNFLSSLPKIQLIESTIEKAAKECENVIVLTIHDQLSSTTRFARNFAASFANIHVVSNHFSGYQFINVALYAEKLINKGHSIEEIIQKIENINSLSHTLLVPKTLDYMIKGGRLTGIKKFLMTKITMIPILSFDLEGKVVPIALKRTIKGAISKCVAKAVELAKELPKPEINWMHGIDQEINDFVLHEIQENNASFTHEQNTSSVVAIHTGPEAFSITIMPQLN
ncbi:DegV family protein [Mycoplasma buteonis]|uniref:DegV family protein n=1 Tax=Mycoplasma buteonis TaxID=171280 RepID=UPI0005637FF1|nr:DegV family protein [Mycoplasma buteonis]